MTRVSIIVTSFNDGVFLPDALLSARDQSHSDLEVIVTDDGSTDPTTTALLDQLAQTGTRVLRNTHGGLSANRNHALALASGDYGVCLDADDRLHPAYVAAAASILDGSPDVALVAPDMQFFGASDHLVPVRYDIGRQLIGNRLPCSTMFRVADLRAIGGFDEALPHHEDFDAWLGILERGGQVQPLGSIGLYRRMHPGQMSAGLGLDTNPAVFAQIARRHGALYAAHAEDAWRALLTEREMLFHYKARYGGVEKLVSGLVHRMRAWRKR